MTNTAIRQWSKHRLRWQTCTACTALLHLTDTCDSRPHRVQRLSKYGTACLSARTAPCSQPQLFTQPWPYSSAAQCEQLHGGSTPGRRKILNPKTGAAAHGGAVGAQSARWRCWLSRTRRRRPWRTCWTSRSARRPPASSTAPSSPASPWCGGAPAPPHHHSLRALAQCGVRHAVVRSCT